MSSISFTGLASGFDSNSVITALVAAERSPVTALQTKQSQVKTQLSTLGDLISKLQSMSTTLGNLDSDTDLASLSGTTSDSTRADISAVAGASSGSYSLHV